MYVVRSRLFNVFYPGCVVSTVLLIELTVCFPVLRCCELQFIKAATSDPHSIVRSKSVEYLTQILNECSDDHFRCMCMVYFIEAPHACRSY